MPGQMNFGLGFCGEYRYILRDLMGRAVLDTGFTPNLITDDGLAAIAGYPGGGTPLFRGIAIGDGGTAATYADEQLDSRLAAAYFHGGGQIDFQAYVNSPSGEYGKGGTQWARFDAGVGTGTIREAGFGYFSNTSTLFDPLISRQVLGAPIVKAADNILDVYYRMKCYVDLSDVTGQVTLESVAYNFTLRPQWDASWVNLFNTIGGTESFNQTFLYGDSGSGSLNDEFSAPTGLTQAGGPIGTMTNEPNINEASYRDTVLYYPVDHVATTNNLRMLYPLMYPGIRLKVWFAAVSGGGAAPKDIEREGTFKVRTTVSRRAGS